MATIIFVDKPAHPFLGEALEAAGHHWEDYSSSSLEKILKVLPGFDGVMVRSRLKIDKAFLEHHPNLKFVARWGVGTEHIDLEVTRQLGIAVFNSPEGSKNTVAEHTVGMLLMLLNNLGRADRQVRSGEWERRSNTGTELGPLTVGIIGYGNMGRETARRLSGFGCRVLAHDKFLENYGDQYAEAVSLERIQAEADVVSLHIFLEGNHHYVNQKWINAFAKPFYLINTARGAAVDTIALLAGLQSSTPGHRPPPEGGMDQHSQVRSAAYEPKILGAALDVIEYEDQSFTQFDLSSQPQTFRRLLELENVIMTPHIAGWSYAAEEGHARTLWDKMQPYL